MPDNVSKALRNLVSAYIDTYGDKVVKIVLYGSHARGTFNEYSDVDVAAIVRGKRQDLQDRLEEVSLISSRLDLKYEVLLSPAVIPYDEYTQFLNDLPYYRNIEREGVCLYECKP